MEHKYQHLLKPLRALADNWDIDVAAELTEYAEIVDRMSQSASIMNSDLNEVNFAQAALLIQNSASIYSRKVQYLFNLTRETHDYIFHNQNVWYFCLLFVSCQLRFSEKKAAANNCDGPVEYQCLDDILIQKDYTCTREVDVSAHLLPQTSNLFSASGQAPSGRELFSVGGGESVGFTSEFDVR